MAWSQRIRGRYHELFSIVPRRMVYPAVTKSLASAL
ncbi:hypothetical protein X732_27880 [Mesorhizobium sp. L2C066B000]|nr:hypothetical protein X732_27880 [Mesorhizobium sp. L2C066B000]